MKVLLFKAIVLLIMLYDDREDIYEMDCDLICSQNCFFVRFYRDNNHQASNARAADQFWYVTESNTPSFAAQ